ITALIARTALVDNATALGAVICVGAAGVGFALIACAALLVAQQAVRRALNIRLTRQKRLTLVGHATFAATAILIRSALHALLSHGVANFAQRAIQRVFARRHAHPLRLIADWFSGNVRTF